MFVKGLAYNLAFLWDQNESVLTHEPVGKQASLAPLFRE